MEAKMIRKSIRSSPRAPWASFGALLGSIVGNVFSTLFLNVEMVTKMVPNGWDSFQGLPLSWYPTSPSRTLPLLQLPLKGTPNLPSASGRRFPEPVVTRGTGKRRRVLEWVVDNRVMIENVLRICKH